MNLRDCMWHKHVIRVTTISIGQYGVTALNYLKGSRIIIYVKDNYDIQNLNHRRMLTKY